MQRKNTPQVLVHIFLWCAMYTLVLYPFFALSEKIPNGLPVILITATVVFYINYLYLVPALLLNNKKVIYILISITILAFIIIVIKSLSPPFLPENLPNRMPSHGDHQKKIPAFHFPIIPILIFTVPYLFSTMLGVYSGWQKNEHLRKRIEKEKTESELQFLKAQLNPHFLFNSLNSIYSLSVKKSSNTPDAIINLSELMRYMLYEANKDLVPLEKELEYIKSYVTMQRLRLADGENVSLKITGDSNHKSVPPLLYISFIENAFKYGTDYQGKTMVKINFTLHKNTIHFKIVNSIGKFKTKTENSGLGLENIKSRLNFLYPNSHELDLKQNSKTFEVNLIINQ